MSEQIMATNPPAQGFLAQVEQKFKGDESGILVPAGFLAIATLDVIPHPGDIGYFYMEKWLLDHQAEIKDRFWIYKAVNYYGWDVAWYLSLFAATYYGGKDVTSRFKVGASVISIGALGYLLWKLTSQKEKASNLLMIIKDMNRELDFNIFQGGMKNAR